MIVDLLLRVMSRFLPPLARQRYLEEWRADAAGATEAGRRRRDVLFGAAVLSCTLDRDLPAHTGEPRGMLPRRLARRGLALFAAAGVVLTGAYLTGGGVVPEGAAATAGVVAALHVAARIAVGAALVVAVLGALYLAGAARTARTRTARATLVAAVLGPALVLTGAWAPGAPGWLFLVGAIVVMLGLGGSMAVIAGTEPLALEFRTAALPRRVTAAIAGLVLVFGIVSVGLVDLLVWNPQAKVPGTELSSIYAQMAVRDGFDLTRNAVLVAVWAGFWIASALVLLALAVRRNGDEFTPRRITIVMLGLVGAAIFFRFFAGFGIGMSIADTFMTSGGDASVVSAVLPYVGQLALAGAAIAVGWAPRVAPRQVAVA
jgi:hypothetical protein